MGITVSYRPTFFNPMKVGTGGIGMVKDYAKLRSLAAEHAQHARHAAARGDHIAQMYHESRAKHLSSARGKVATMLSARTGIGIGRHAGETFGTGIKHGWSPAKHVGTYTAHIGRSGGAKPSRGGSSGGGGGGGGGVHRDSHGRFA